MILITSSFILSFTDLGRVSLWNNNEPRYAHTARNMLESGDWIIPRYKGKLRVDKPILTYWLIAASSKLINHGEVNEFTARFPFALMGIMGVMIIFFLGRSLYNEKAGFIAGFSLLFTCEYIITARRCLPDMALCFFVLLTFYFLYLGYKSEESKDLYLLAYIPAALGFLTKGPVAIIIPIVAILLYLAAKGELKEVRNLQLLWGSILFLALVLPWFLAVGAQFSEKFFLLHNLKRFLKGLDHQRPWYFYLQALPFDYAPPAFFLPAGLWLFRKEKEKSPLLLPLLWFFTVIVIFSLAAAKRVVYLLPCAPPLALITGIVIAKELDCIEEKGFKALSFLGIGLSFLALTFAPFLPLIFKMEVPKWFYVLALVPLFCITLYLFRPKESVKLLLTCLGLFFFIAWFTYFIHFQPRYDRCCRSATPLAETIKPIVNHAPLYRLGSFDAALEYYLGRPYLPKISYEELKLGVPGRFFVISKGKNLKKLRRSARDKLRLVLKAKSRGKEFVLLESSHLASLK